jgi:SAM-dependent methyltransferase
MSLTRKIYNLVNFGIGKSAKIRKKRLKMTSKRSAFRADFRPAGSGILVRPYQSYDAYVKHQAGKLDRIAGRLREVEDQDYAAFVERFRTCAPLRQARAVLCLGARLGTEVRALHALGHFAVGIDLNPGPDNAYVLPGDFHRIQFPDGSADAVYTNALDHAFDVGRLVVEIGRVLRPGGLLIADVVAGYDEGQVPGPWEAMHWARADDIAALLVAGSCLEMVETRDLGRLREGHWRQLVLRKPPAEQAAAVDRTS